jgi:tRNA(Ile)-lysidine synthase
MALLLLANQTLPDRLFAATVDHQLRPESSDEAQHVHSICQNLGIPHVILTPDEAICGNIQSSARTARYKLLESAADAQNCTYIATAHHADDQLETILMRLARGSGVDGLSSIRAYNGRVIRPLLKFNKAELVALCAEAGIVPVDDPSNSNADFARVAMRNWLATTDHPFRSDRAVRTAEALAAASDALAWMTDWLASQRIRSDNEVLVCDASEIPDELKRRLLMRCLTSLDPDIAPRGDAIDRLMVDLANGRIATIGDVKCVGGAHWRFSPAPPRRS